MKISSLVQGIPILESRGEANPEISGICHDSRNFRSGQLFVALKGFQTDGHTYLSEIVKKGATALVVEDFKYVPQEFKGAVLLVKDSRRALDRLAHSFFGKPTSQLFVAGVTGTNGKTTTTYMIEAI